LAKTVQTVSVPGTNAGVTRAADAFDEFCLSANVPNVAKWRFQLALDELLSNIVRHGYAGAAGHVSLTFARTADAVAVEIVDTAREFDPRRAPAPDVTSPLESRRPGGLGVFLAESLLDELSYERRGDENHVTLVWRWPFAAANEPRE
jgi:serine/threonine-protein kinase RsbW